MSRSTSVFTRVLVRRAVATQGYATLLTRSQVDPLGADLYAFIAFAAHRMFHLGDRGKVYAGFVSHGITSFLDTREQTGPPSRLRRQQRQRA